jgi:UDP-glucose 4-epimerase
VKTLVVGGAGYIGSHTARVLRRVVSDSYNFITALPVRRLAVFVREQGVEV